VFEIAWKGALVLIFAPNVFTINSQKMLNMYNINSEENIQPGWPGNLRFDAQSRLQRE
jgi:hypothetical protein